MGLRTTLGNLAVRFDEFLALLLGGFVLAGVQGVDSIWSAEAKTGWQVQWERTLEAAKKERAVAVYAPSGIEYQNVMMEFQKRYPDIKLNYVAGSGSVHGPRIVTERRAGKYLADLLVGGSTTPVAVLLPAQALDPIRPHLLLAEVSDESKWWRKKFHFIDPQSGCILMMEGGVSQGGIAYNTKLVKADEIRAIQSHWDLLDPKWKGKIVARDPRSPGSSQNLPFYYYHSKLGPGFLYRLFTETDLTLTRDPRLLIDWLAQGKFHLALFVATDVDRGKEQGLPVDSLTHRLKEGSSIGSGFGTLSLLNRAPHPSAAKVFINWLLSREGQLAWQKNTNRNSLRMDIPKDNIPPDEIPTEGGDYFVRTTENSDVRPIFKVIEEALAKRGRK